MQPKIFSPASVKALIEQLTLGWLTFYDASPAEVVTAAASADFQSVGLRITGRSLHDESFPIVGDNGAIREIHRRLAYEGVRLSNTSIYHLSPEVTLEHIKPAIEVTAELGAKTIVITCMDSDEARWTAFIATCCNTAAQFNITLALEVVPYSEAQTLEQGLRIVDNAGADNFGLLIDALHIARSGATPDQIGKIDPEKIVFAQLCDAMAQKPPELDLPSEARNGRLYPGDGELPLFAFLDALPDAIEIEVETPRTDQAHLSYNERAQRAGDATRKFLTYYRRLLK